MEAGELCRVTRHNCDISDALHSGTYSVCTLVLKLRNLFKWERGLEPWQEPEPAEVLAWIEQKETGWEELEQAAFLPLRLERTEVEPFAVSPVNRTLEESGSSLYYGAGYGRSLKPVFFLAEKLRQESVEGYPVTILGAEKARELASPFAMVQDGRILIRMDPLRFFLHDQIRDIRSSGQEPLNRSLSLYGVLDRDGRLSAARFAAALDVMVENELPIFIHHELGELQKSGLDREILRKLAASFPGSAAEFTVRAVYDLLADTEESGMLGYILRERRETSLCFYIAFLDGMRQVLFPEIRPAADRFLKTGDWEAVEAAMAAGRTNNLARAAQIRELCGDLPSAFPEQVGAALEEKLLRPLGLFEEPHSPQPPPS